MAKPSPPPLKAKVSAGHPFFEIIEEAYRVFDYPKPSSTEVCRNCCMDDRIEADFFNPPIRRLPLEYIQDWYDAAYDPQAGVAKATWAYLLPRILEILAAGEDVARVAIEVVLRRFVTGNPSNWSAKEWAVLDRFQRKFLQHRIKNGSDEVDSVLCMFKHGGWSLDALMAQLEAAPSEALAVRLWRDWCSWQSPGMEGIWLTPFWESNETAPMLEFYTSDALYAKMEAVAFDDGTDPEIAAKASAVASLIKP